MYVQLTLRHPDRDHSPQTFVKFYEIEQITPRSDKTPGCRVYLVSGRALDVLDTVDSLVGEPVEAESPPAEEPTPAEEEALRIAKDAFFSGTEDAVKEGSDTEPAETVTAA
jgi:hypothetical protein